jgi:phospholipid/cholesterol/gamma-HCH transport system substrate-binding protein
MLKYLKSNQFKFRDFNNLFVGAFLMLGLALMFIYAILTLEQKNFFADTYVLYAKFEKGLGIHKGTKVQINGVPVGEVSVIQLMPDGTVLAKLSVERSPNPENLKKSLPYNKHISRISEVYTTRDKNLISDRVLFVTHGGSQYKPLQNNDTLVTAESQDIETLLENVNELLSKIDRIAIAADSVMKMTLNPKSTIGALLGSDDLYRNIEHQLTQFNSVVNQASALLNVLNKATPTLVTQADTIANNMIAISKKGVSAFNEFDAVLGKADNILGKAETLVGRLHNLMIDSEEKLEKVDDLVSSLNSWWLIRSRIPKKESIEILQEDLW